jgi:hypothetical protein
MERPGCHPGFVDLSGGAFIFLGFVVVFALALGYSLYTLTGSGISQRPWRNCASSLSHDETATSLWRRYRPSRPRPTTSRPKTTASTRLSSRRP